MYQDFIHAISPLTSKGDLNPSNPVWLVGVAWIAYGCWMMAFPDRHWEKKKNELERLEFGDLSFRLTARRESRRLSLRSYLRSANPRRRVRLTGCCIALTAIAFECIVWRKVLYGLFVQ